MKLSTKLIGSFSIVVLIVGGIGLTASYLNDAVKDQVTLESDKAIQEVTLTGELGLQLFKSLTRTQYLLEDSYRESLSMNYSRSNRTREVQIAEIEKSLEKFEESLDQLRSTIQSETNNIFEYPKDSSKVLGLLEELENKYRNYSALITQFQNISDENYQDRKEFFTVTIEPYFRTNLLPNIEQLRSQIQKAHQQQIAGLNNQLDKVGYILVISTGIALIIAIILSLFIYRSIANPIAQIAEAAERFGQGNLQNRINYDSDDELGQLSDTFDQMAENLSKTTVSRDYVDSIIEAIADSLIVTDEHCKIRRVNSAALEILDRTEEELLNESVDCIFDEMPDDMLDGFDTETSNTYTGTLKHKNQAIPVSISRGTINNKDSGVKGYVFVASDISSEKKAQQKIAESLKEKEVLLAEIHHRVKNNLAVISGLLQMQMWESESPKAKTALQQSHLRVQSIALVHEKLYQSESLSYIQFNRYLDDLLETISDVYMGDKSDIEIQSNIEDITLTVNQAIPCALLINELVNNAFKYAFDNGENGIISVTLKQLDDKILTKVSDNGVGIQDNDENPGSLELNLVNTLTKQLNGRLSFYNDDGAHIEVTFIAEDIL
jgi:PAS domain S-box-containing protein